MLKALTTFAALALATPASAITIIEGADFDAPGPNVGTLAVGDNSIAGFLDATCVSIGTPFFNCQGDSFDQVLFDVADGTRLVTGTLTGRGQNDPGMVLRAGMSFVGDLGERYSADTTFGTVTEIQEFGSLGSLNLGPGTYFLNISAALSNSVATGPLVLQGSWAAEFRVEPILAPVPLPAGAALLITALGALAVTRRRA